MASPVRYRSFFADNARWDGLASRPDDIVISTPPKCGTTWMQMCCALLIFRTADFRQPLTEVSPWLNMHINDPAVVVARLVAQKHRRFIKSHTPLDGLPYDERVKYICVGRDPRDVGLSWQNHGDNTDIDALITARINAVGIADLAEFWPPPDPPPEDPIERSWLWVDDAKPLTEGPSGLCGTLHHLQTFWDASDRPNVALFHYRDLLTDLRGEMRRLADFLEIAVSDAELDTHAAAASFDKMKARANELVPEGNNQIWQDNAQFFERGPTLATADLAAWVHR